MLPEMTEAHIRVMNTPAGRLSVVPSEVWGDTESLGPALIVPVAVELFDRDGQSRAGPSRCDALDGSRTGSPPPRQTLPAWNTIL